MKIYTIIIAILLFVSAANAQTLLNPKQIRASGEFGTQTNLLEDMEWIFDNWHTSAGYALAEDMAKLPTTTRVDQVEALAGQYNTNAVNRMMSGICTNDQLVAMTNAFYTNGFPVVPIVVGSWLGQIHGQIWTNKNDSATNVFTNFPAMWLNTVDTNKFMFKSTFNVTNQIWWIAY